MAKGSKQKVYEEPEDEQYIVVTDPFRMPRSNRTQRHVEETAAWLQRVFDTKNGIISIFIMGTKTEIIVSMEKDIDVMPALGQHRWGAFAPRLTPADADRVSCIFQYNYRLRGDPASHQWKPMYPERQLDLHLVSPYPPPTWCEPTASIAPLVLLPPRPVDPAPAGIRHGNNASSQTSPPSQMSPPAQERNIPQPTAARSPNPHAFTPYQRPAQLPQRVQDGGEGPSSAAGQVKREIKQESSLPALSKKYDPYEEEDAAFDVLRENLEETKEEPRDSSLPDATIKPDPDINGGRRHGSKDDYRPSNALLDAFRQLSQNTAADDNGSSPIVKAEAELPGFGSNPALGYEPSPSLIDALSRLVENAPTINNLKRPKSEDDDESETKLKKRVKEEMQ
ncbi:hypothetical protein GLOTRDRAFT_129524 [Gloeophyllum trabeum ATCC 11539]|uniref:Uncharacterized protein n=1 Tax=Gloeophyllum trabeum (strain ATCC 11539 / FP-39264 / Madison 617) TaxID=670483 RepID=S7Q722_GLOTA|nr:uncharacterized protein GLOTRDRAFT_129524 [Gloeophyllum trabeum ATCC 11539]EPQ55238.1 hypothetical protein GLOTRDRAFT_129524 [Gloeophyllum trabeum ATCC 11539]